MAPDRELDHFKSSINLTEYAASCGYVLDKKASCQNSVVMRCGSDKLVIARELDGHWVYFSVRDESDHGSIIDFVQRRQRLNLGEVRKTLRAWNGFGSLYSPGRDPATFVADLRPVERDLAGVRARWEATGAIGGRHPYLETVRGISAAVLASERFAGRVRIDDRGNAIFPHWNNDGLCGFEIKNEGFTGFAPGGVKGLWGSRKKEDDQQLVIAETAIDALSYATLFGFERSRFLSTAGAMNEMQPELFRQAIALLPPGGIIVAAVDNDHGGTALLERLRRETRREIIEDRPEEDGQDWNDVLRARS